MDYLPICVDVRGRPCLVVGGGDIAARKADLLVRAGADVRVVAPELGEAVQQLAQAGDATLLQRPFEEADLEGVLVVIAATDEASANRTIAAAAQLRGLWVNVVDDPAHCNFVMPAIVDRDPLLVAISSGGRSPVLARHVRGRIEAMLPHRLGELAVLLGSYRPRVKARFSTIEMRRRFWEGIVEGEVAELAIAGRMAEAKAALEAALEAADGDGPSQTAFVVAVRSTDPDDLTFRMLRLMQRAGVVVHAAEVPAAIVELCRRDATRAPAASGGTGAIVEQLRAAAAAGQRPCFLSMGAHPGVRDGLAAADIGVVDG